jgi:integrase
LFHVVIFRGLRRGEALGLTWPEIDLTNATLTVSQQLLEHDVTLVLAPPKTEASRWTFTLDRTTVAVLRRHQVTAARGGSRAHRQGWCSPRPGLTSKMSRICSAAVNS